MGREPEYKLTTLLIEVQGADSADKTWHEMARVSADELTTASQKFDFKDAHYQYSFRGYQVSQDPITGLFSVKVSETFLKDFEIKLSSSNDAGIDKYILFNFKTEGDNQFSEISDNIRITALFRKFEADVRVEKDVLLNPKSSPELVHADNKNYQYNSLQQSDATYEVDGSGITGENLRRAIISGDELTYRMRVYNTGFFEAGTVNVFDYVPEGSTFVPGSMKIYSQEADFSSSTARYSELVEETEVSI